MMKILFVSDIHGITNNLKIIEQLEKKEKFDKIVVLGDLYYAGPTYKHIYDVNSKSVLDFLMQFNEKIIGIRGNCDSDVDIKATDFPISDKLALICVDGLDIYCTHGNEYNKDKDRKFNRTGVLVYGHEHIPYIERKENMVFINVGSLSLPRNDFRPTYLIYENRKFTIYTIDNDIVDSVLV